MQKKYPHINPKQNFPQLEREVLNSWMENNTFQKSLEQTKQAGKGNFVFYDGPPFANGLPHYGHLLTGYVKDVIPRYQTMQGKYVSRIFGWDCHGLPAEMESQKQLGINGRKEIITYGIADFNSFCQKSVMKYVGEWEAYVNRQARWVDFKNGYKTMDSTFMESVIWAFSELWKKGLVYEGNKVMPYSWALETPLSNFETRLDNAYRNRQDPAITVAFKINASTEDKPLVAMVWTTTPWTLPANLGLAVNPKVDYQIIEQPNARFLLAAAATERYPELLKDSLNTETLKGEELVGLTYTPMFDYFKSTANAFKVLGGDFVAEDSGTGIVHLSPGFGEDDFQLCAEHGIPPLCPIDSKARYTSEVSDLEGIHVFDANKIIIKRLKESGELLKQQTIDHSYPHCWRTDTPLIYKAQKSWYIKVSTFKDRMVELNKEINWVPDHVKNGSFGNWLENAKDWSISRNRFFGTPIPIWQSDNPQYPRIDVYGSFEQLKVDFGVEITDLHRPHIDELTRPNPDDPTGKSMMHRIEDVFDCWFESGSMPFAQLHYPFENKNIFEENFPADFVVEYVAQTRGWFYTMMVMATALFDKPPFKNAICHGVINDEDGEKLSKSKRNYPDPINVFEEHGADALRWFLMGSSVLRGGDLIIDRHGAGISDAVRKLIIPYWNAYSFFCLYANGDSFRADYNVTSNHVLDRFILSELRNLVSSVTVSLDELNIPKACADLEQFIEVLNNWYIRRSRERFWAAELTEDKKSGYRTLFSVLHILSRLMAPFIPFTTEAVFQGLGAGESVHLAEWPSGNDLPENKSLVQEMNAVIDICGCALSIRKANHIRVRQPLASITIYMGEGINLVEYQSIICAEVNVKEVVFTRVIDQIGSSEIVINHKAVGPKIGKGFKDVLIAVKENCWIIDKAGNLNVAGYIIGHDYFQVKYSPKTELRKTAKTLEKNNGLIVIDTSLSVELIDEGIARDFVRAVQTRRKDLALDMYTHISLEIQAPESKINALIKHERFIKEQTLTTRWSLSRKKAPNFQELKFEISQ